MSSDDVTAEQRPALRERAVASAKRSCAKQSNIPVKMIDPLALAEIADILLAARSRP